MNSPATPLHNLRFIIQRSFVMCWRSLGLLVGVYVLVAGSMIMKAQELPTDFPPLPVSITGSPSPGVFVLSPNTRILTTGYGYFVMVLDSAGKPLKWHRMPRPAFDCKVTKSGQIGYTVYSPQSVSIGQSGVYLLDTNMQIVDSVFMQNGYLTSQHGFDVLPNGNKLVYGWEEVPVDMSKVVPNGHPAAIVVQGLLQEQDPDGNVVFQWRSLDNVPWDASNARLTDAYIRSVHNNGLDVDADGHYLLSLRTLSSIIKVDRDTGSTLWYFGGKKNQFTYLNDAGTNGDWSFRSQHDPRRIFNGHLTLFDNGNDKPDQYSRGVEYELDETAKTASVVWQNRQTPDVFANQQGGLYTMRDGHRVLAWGTSSFDETPALTEVDANGNVVLSMHIPKEFALYKAEKHTWPLNAPLASATFSNVLPAGSYDLKGPGERTVAILNVTMPVSATNNVTMQLHPFGSTNVRFDTKAPWIYPRRITLDMHGAVLLTGSLQVFTDELGIPGDRITDVQVWGRDTIGSGEFKRVSATHQPGVGSVTFNTAVYQEYIFGIPQLPYTPNQPVLAYPQHLANVSNRDTLEFRAFPQGRHDSTIIEYGMVASDDSVWVFGTRGERARAGILADGRYWWHARSMWDGVEGPWTDTAFFTVGDPYMHATVPNTDVIWPRDSSVTIRWETNVVGPVKLVLMYGATEVLTIAASVSGATGAYVWKVPLTAPLATGYSIQAQSIAALPDIVIGVGPSAITIVDGVTSVAEDAMAKSMHLSPNPASELMRLRSDNMLVHRIVLYSQMGAHITTIEGPADDDIVFDISTLAPGMYVCEIHTAVGVVHKSFVKL